MTPDAYRAILGELRLSHSKAARLLGVTQRTSERWIAGDRDIPAPAFRLLVLLRDFDISPDEATRHFIRTIPETP